LLKILHLESLFPIEESVPASYRPMNDGVAHREIVFRDGILATDDKT
jgi:hypothetical protein